MLVLSQKSTLIGGVVTLGPSAVVSFPVKIKGTYVREGFSSQDDTVILRLETLHRLVTEEVENTAVYDSSVPDEEQIISNEVHEMCMEVQRILEKPESDGHDVDRLSELLNSPEMIELICSGRDPERIVSAA